jgi:hypothetical protein
MKTMTKDSIIEAIESGATSLTKVAHAHGYTGSVSGSVSAKIRTLVPDVAERLPAKTVKVAPVLVVHMDMPFTATEQTETVKGAVGTVVLDEAHPVEVAPKVEAPKAKKVAKTKAPAIVVPQGKSPYRGKVYARVFAEVVAAGETEVRPFITVTAKKLHLTEMSVRSATNVFRIPKHQSNGGRSKDISEQRGYMHVVPAKAEAV